jgi:macrolide-specific efflux system membrane fusion protein
MSSALAPPLRRRARKRGRLLVLLLVLGLAGGGAWYALSPGQAAAPPPTAEVTRGDLQQTITALGTLQPKDYVDVGVQVSGQLMVIHVDYGTAVKQGDLLAEIDPKVYQARVDSDRAELRILEAQLAQSQAQLELARQQDARNQRLWKSKAVSEDALQSGIAALAVAEAELRALEAQIEQARSTLDADLANLDFTKIYAPMDGTVVDILARQGQTLNANQSAPLVLRVADLDTMTVWAEVVEADVVRIAVGMPVHFSTLGLPDRRWEGTVRQILPTPEIVNDVVLYKVLIDVANPDHLLMTEMSAQVFFRLGEAKDVLLVPLAALESVSYD